MKATIGATVVKTWGNSLGVRIPKKVADALGLHDGSQIKISLDGNKIMLESESNPFFDLSQDDDTHEQFKNKTSNWIWTLRPQVVEAIDFLKLCK